MARVISGLNRKANMCIDALVDSVPGNYIGTALDVENKMSGWARKEVSVLNPRSEAP